MTQRLLSAAFAIVALAALAGKSHAQYVYLDANGDGVWSSADRMNANGTPTVVDAWINTNHNKDGTLAICDTSDGNLGFWNSFAANLQVVSGTATFSDFINQQSTFDLTCVDVGIDFASNSTEMTACRATGTSEQGGLKKMFTVTITGVSGTPWIRYIALGSIGPNFTSFGTPCSGNDFDNTYKLGSDFFDNDGLATFTTDDIAPAVFAPATATFSAGLPSILTVSCLDPDAGQTITSLTSDSSPATTGSMFTSAADNTSGTFSWTPSISQVGTYILTFTASNTLSSTAATTLNVVSRPPVVMAARIFTSGGNNKTSLASGKPYTTFQIESIGGSFDNANVVLSSIRMSWSSSNQIFADASKTGIAQDKDGNGVPEISASFRKEDLRVLFAGLPAGDNIMRIEIRGNVVGGAIGGAILSGSMDHVVKSNGSFLAASTSPNPLNPRAKLTFTTTKPGAVRVQMFDLQGRLVKSIGEEPVARAGLHNYMIDGRSATGSKLASGVYFVKVWTEHDGDEVQRIAILK